MGVFLNSLFNSPVFHYLFLIERRQYGMVGRYF